MNVSNHHNNRYRVFLNAETKTHIVLHDIETQQGMSIAFGPASFAECFLWLNRREGGDNPKDSGVTYKVFRNLVTETYLVADSTRHPIDSEAVYGPQSFADCLRWSNAQGAAPSKQGSPQ